MLVATERGFFAGGQAFLLGEGEHRLQAWAERFVRKDPDIKFLLGNYVEANQANLNGHTFPLAELAPAVDTVIDKPLNMLHREQHIVGTFVGAQLLTPEGVELTAEDVGVVPEGSNPYVEALSALWHRRFPEEYFDIRRAHAEGSLYYSMEAVPVEVSCPTCGLRAAFDGLENEAYCDHMQGVTGPKILHEPVFAGGAIVIPPAKPGWQRADMKTIAKYMADPDFAAQAESVYAQLSRELPHLGVQEWESMMGEIMMARTYSDGQRQEMARKGQALPDGSYPIADMADLRNAMQAFGRANPSDRSKVKAHILKRAKALGAPAEMVSRIEQYEASL